MFESNPSAKVRFLALGELPAPGSCFVCGSGNREEGYVDLGLWLEFIGEALICHTCVIEVGEVIGMMIPDEVQTIHTKALELATENESLKTQLEESNERLNAYDLAFSRVINPSDLLASLGRDSGQPTLSEAVDGSDSGSTEITESDSSDGESGRIRETESDDGSKQESIPAFRL